MTYEQDLLAQGYTKSGDPESPDWTGPSIGNNFFDKNLNAIDPTASKFTDDFYGSWQPNEDAYWNQEYTPLPTVNFNGKQWDVPEYMMGNSVNAEGLRGLGIDYIEGPGGKPLVDPNNPMWKYVTDIQRQKNKQGEKLSAALWMAPLAMVGGPMLAAGIGNAGAGAVIGGTTSGISGGNVLKGAAMGALGGALAGSSGAGDAAGGSYGGDFAGTTNAWESGASLGDLYASGGAGAGIGDYFNAFNNSSLVSNTKDAYGMYKKGTETIGALKSLFGSNNNGSNNFRMSNSTPTLGSIYNTGTLNPNLDPYGLAGNNRRRASRGR